MHTLSRQETAPCFNKLHGSVTQFTTWEHEKYYASLTRGELLSCLCNMNVKSHPHLLPSLCVCVCDGVTTTQWLPCAKHFFKHLYILTHLILVTTFSSVTQSCPTLYDPMNRSMPGLPVHYQYLEFTQTHVHQVGEAIQTSHTLSSPSPPALNLS